MTQLREQINALEAPYRARLSEAKKARLEPAYRLALDTPTAKRTTEQLQRVSRHASHQISMERRDHRQPTFIGQPQSDIARGIEVMPGLD